MKKLILLILLVLSLVLVSCDNSVSDKGKLHILSVGDNFTSGSGLRVLKSCINDANATAEVLTKLAGDAGVTIGTKKILLDGDGSEHYPEAGHASVDNLRNEILSLAESASPNDLTVIFVSTHGNNDIRSRVSYGDTIVSDAHFFLKNIGNYYDIEDYKADISRIPGTVLVLSDFCFSGSLIDQNNITFNINNYSGTDPVRILFSESFVRESSKVFYLSASTYFQESKAGGDNELSVFTDYMLKALGISKFDAEGVHYASSIPAKKGNKILLSDIYAYIYKESMKDNKAQVVQMSSGTNDLVLFTY